MGSKLDLIESLAKTRSVLVINKLAGKLGVEVDIHKHVQDAYSDVYGINADKAPKGGVIITKNVIITGDQFIAYDDYSISTMQEGFVYDPDGDIEVGDMIEVKRDGGRVRQFQVVHNEGVGSTRVVLDRFKIIPVGE